MLVGENHGTARARHAACSSGAIGRPCSSIAPGAEVVDFFQHGSTYLRLTHCVRSGGGYKHRV